MAAIAFPALKPSSRSYAPGKYPISEFAALNGAKTRVIYGNRRSDAELSLGFQNITDAQAASVLAHYELITPTGDWASFSTNDGAAGASAPLADYLREVGGSGLRWRYADAPSITSVHPGRSTVSVKFVGQLDG
jgi:hypothetical protein